jgi:hypothetical protein
MALGAEALDVRPVNSSYTMPGAMLGTKRMVTASRRCGEISLTASETIQGSSLSDCGLQGSLPAVGDAFGQGNGAGLNPTFDCGVDGISEALLSVATELIHALVAGAVGY